MYTAGQIVWVNQTNKYRGRCIDTGIVVKEGHGRLGAAFLSDKSFRWCVLSAFAVADRVNRGEAPVELSSIEAHRKIGLGTTYGKVDPTIRAMRRGRTTGMAMVEAFRAMFADNEKRKAAFDAGDKDAQPLTDAEIAAWMGAEFPDLPFKAKSVGRVKSMRRKYNLGERAFRRWGKPQQPSFEYDESGQRGEVKPERRRISRGVDEARVAELVKEAVKRELAAQPASTITIQWSPRKQTKFDARGKHKMLQTVLRKVSAGINVLLVGPTGCGKTVLARHVAEALKLPFTFNSMSEGVSESSLLGRVVPNEKGAWAYHESPFVKSYRDGGVHLFDELDAADANLLVQINAPLSNGLLSLPFASSKPIKMHDDFVAIAAANTFGTGSDREYVGRNPLDGSTLNRYQMGMVIVDYDTDLEMAIAAAVLRDKALAGELVKWAWAVRERINASRLRRVMSTRDVHSAAKLIAAGDSLDDVKRAYSESWSEDERRKIEVAS